MWAGHQSPPRCCFYSFSHLKVSSREHCPQSISVMLSVCQVFTPLLHVQHAVMSRCSALTSIWLHLSTKNVKKKKYVISVYMDTFYARLHHCIETWNIAFAPPHSSFISLKAPHSSTLYFSTPCILPSLLPTSIFFPISLSWGPFSTFHYHSLTRLSFWAPLVISKAHL